MEKNKKPKAEPKKEQPIVNNTKFSDKEIDEIANKLLEKYKNGNEPLPNTKASKSDSDFDKKLKDLESKIDSTNSKVGYSFIKKLLLYKGFIIYFYNKEKLNCEIIPLTEIKPTVRIRKYAETFELGIPAFFLHGKPTWILFRNIPFSVELDISNLDNWKEIQCITKMKPDKNGKDVNVEYHKEILQFKGYSASEIDAKLNSIYVNRLFRQKGLTKLQYLSIALTNIVSILLTYMITYQIYFSMLGVD